MKKIISVMLVLLMIFGSITAIFADEGGTPVPLKPGILISPRPSSGPADVAGTTYEEAVKALMASKIVSGYTDGTFRPENTLTRAEACAFLVNYLAPTEEERNAAADSGFADVTGWATTFVNYAVEKGLVKGYTDGTFRPSNKVNYQELAAMTVNALGIDPEELIGGWPDAYINKAKELGMYENISVSKKNQEEANRGDTAEMIYSLIKYKDTSAKDAVAARLVKSNEALQNVKSMSYEMVMDMGMSMIGESIDMKSVMKLDMILEPMSMYMLADIQSLGEQQNVEYYYVTEGEDLVMYMQVEGQWYKMNMGYALTAAMPENPMENMDLYLKAYNGLRMEGTDLVDGKKATKIHCELGDEYIEEMMKEVGLADQVMGDMTPEEEVIFNETLKAMKGFGYDIWIDEETDQLVKIHMDMTELMKDLMGETVDKMRIEMVLTNVNQLEEITLPEELNGAVDLGSSTGSEQTAQ